MKVFVPAIMAITLGFAATIHAAPKDNQQLTDDMAIVQQGLDKIQSEMGQLRRLLDNRAMLELFQRMDDLADEVSSLRGMLEQQNHELDGLKKRQRELYLDIDRRLRDLESTATRAPVVQVPPAPMTEADEVPPAPGSEQPQAGAQPETGVSVPAVSAPPIVEAPAQPAVPKPAVVPAHNKPSEPVSEERDQYQKAFDMLKEGRYKMASAAFRDFIDKFPNSSYAGNSQYWLGEASYVTRQFDQAVSEFKKVLERYPSSNKVPDAMLKLGYTYYEIRSNDQAKAILDQLIQQHPKSTAARLAGKRLLRMKREGL